MTPPEEDALGAIAEVPSDTLRWLIGDDDPRRPIGYALLYTEDQLRAAVAQEMERAAKVADDMAHGYSHGLTREEYEVLTDCAAAIRRGE